jgi:hypothetical protein
MPLSWNEIKTRAYAFAKEWEHESSEGAEAKSFWDGFFEVFGISRRRVATFETPVKKLDHKQGFIDLLWKGYILVEHKSRGKDLDKAVQQAKDYFPGLTEKELPRYILVSDFQRFRLYDLESGEQNEFELNDLPEKVHLFGFMAGYEKRSYKEEDPVNIEAAELMGKLHDRLKEVGYTGHALELYLVRLLFCLFADDTGIFEKGIFWEYLDRHTKPDGSDLAAHLGLIFHTLNIPREQRLRNLDESLASFPYVNGKLFEETLPPAAFDSKMRSMLIDACALDWGSISPAIFGSMFQSVMNPKERRNLGAHYTSEKNIQKVIKPLFLDDLYAEFEKAKGNTNRLRALHQKIASLHFLDPACGCGNFLIISYRELRQLELQILRELNKSGQGVLDVREIIKVDVDQFAGIEYDEFPALIAEVAMWLIDHQMNMKVSEEFGQYFVRLPLTKAAKIVHGNALRLDWRQLFHLPAYDIYTENVNIMQVEEPEAHYRTVNVFTKNVNLYTAENASAPMTAVTNGGGFFDFVLGNPPFIGKQMQNDQQRADMNEVFKGVQGAGVLDYVAAWYLKAAQYIQNTKSKVAFVSTNSISQGEQVGVLWSILFNFYKIKIHFAHRTFRWSNEARGNAAVHVVIIGFGTYDEENKRIFDYTDIAGEPQERLVKSINPYLVEGPASPVFSRPAPISGVPPMSKGSQPTDGGNLILTEIEKETFIKEEPLAAKYLRPFMGSDEFINSTQRWCLWLKDAAPTELRAMASITERIGAVRDMRMASSKAATRKWAQFPTLFTENRQPESDYLLIPSVSSENRKYIPIGYMDKRVVVSNLAFSLPNATPFLFGVLSSEMHMAWVRSVCGRLKSDYRYSNTIVYNNFPFPLHSTDTQKKKVEEAAQAVLDTRAKYPDSSLADLYSPVTMPPDLVKAHQVLDKAVDQCYRSQPFANELSRIEFLFGLYEQYTTGLFAGAGKKGKKK